MAGTSSCAREMYDTHRAKTYDCALKTFCLTVQLVTLNNA